MGVYGIGLHRVLGSAGVLIILDGIVAVDVYIEVVFVGHFAKVRRVDRLGWVRMRRECKQLERNVVYELVGQVNS